MSEKKYNNIFEQIMNNIAFVMCITILVTILVFGFFYSANYSFMDYPFFSKLTFDRVVYLSISACLLISYMLIGKMFKWDIRINFFIFTVISLLFVFIIPLEPFSDMKNIYEIAINGFKDEQGYLSNCPNQIPITTYLWVITSIFGKNILIPKIFNIICNVGIIYFLYKIYLVIADTNELSSDKKAIMWFSTPILSVVLYENHIYNDILFTFLTTILIYLVLKKQDTNLIFAIVCVLSVVQYVIRPTGIIYIIAIFLYMVLYQQHYRKALVYVLVCVSLIFGVGKLNKKIFNVDTMKEYPVWSYIQMGVNEQEFGFQDGSHSMAWTKEDCVEKYKSLGIKKLLKIYAKKEIWMWSEGTYQAERYGLGDYYATFTKDNKITETVRNVDNSMIRKVLEQVMKAQYYIYMFFALVGLLTVWKRNRKDMRLQVLLLYVICGFFCFYLVWEIKSRYIYSLYPIFMIYGFIGFSIFVDGIEKIFGGNR